MIFFTSYKEISILIFSKENEGIMNTTYSMNHNNESSRLEKQSLMHGYCPNLELNNCKIKENGRILDAGCGTGIMARSIYKKYPNSTVDACDCSEDRINKGKLFAKMENLNIHFFYGDINNLPSSEKEYDSIVCRYVIQHLSDYKKVMNEFSRILKPSGNLNIIELDGIFHNYFSGNQFIEESLNQLRKNFNFDLFVGRKLPFILKQHNFKNISWKMELVEFKEANKKDEYIMMKERLDHCRQAIEIILGKKDTQKFISNYLQELFLPETIIFFNKIIVNATKAE